MSAHNKSSKVIAALALFFSLLLVAVLMMSGTHAQASSMQKVKVPAPVPTSPSTAMPPSATPTSTGTPGVPGPVTTSIPANCTLNFSDVQPTDWFFPYVQWMVCNNIAGGYNDGSFRPNNNATRAQMSKMVELAFTTR